MRDIAIFSTDASKQNVVIALPRDVHVEVNKAQYTLNSKMQAPVDNIISNADILYNHSSVPNSNVDKALQDVLKHYSNVKK